MIPASELARRICLANHDPRLRRRMPSDAQVPCGEHRALADRTFGLTQPDGAASLLVLCAAAGLTVSEAREPATPTEDTLKALILTDPIAHGAFKLGQTLERRRHDATDA